MLVRTMARKLALVTIGCTMDRSSLSSLEQLGALAGGGHPERAEALRRRGDPRARPARDHDPGQLRMLAPLHRVNVNRSQHPAPSAINHELLPTVAAAVGRHVPRWQERCGFRHCCHDE